MCKYAIYVIKEQYFKIVVNKKKLHEKIFIRNLP